MVFVRRPHRAGGKGRRPSPAQIADNLGHQTALLRSAEAQACAKAGDHARAVGLLTQALELHPDNSRFFFQRANCYRGLGDEQRGLLDFSLAIRLEPTAAQYYAGRGALLRALGRTGEALADLDTATSLEPASPAFHIGRALVLDAMDQRGAAIDALGDAVQLGLEGQQPAQVLRARLQRGLLLHAAGRCREAVAELRHVVAQSGPDRSPDRRRMDKGAPERGAALGALGLALVGMGDAGAALPVYDQAIALDGRTAALLSHRAGALRALGRFREALALLAEAIELRPADGRLRAQLGEALLASGRLADAADAFAVAAELSARGWADCAVPDPDPGVTAAGLHVPFSRALRLLARWADASAQLDAALAAAPGLAAAHQQRGLLELSLGRYAEALEAFARAAAPAPPAGEEGAQPRLPDGDALAGMGAALLDSGHAADALGALGRALALQPRALGARLLRARALLALSEAAEARGTGGDGAGPGGDNGGSGGLLHEALADVQAALAEWEAGAGVPGAAAAAAAAAPDDDDDDEERKTEPSALRAELLGLRARLRLAAGEPERGLADASAALDAGPDDARWLQARALCRAALGDLRGALVDLNTAVRCAQAALAHGGGAGGGVGGALALSRAELPDAELAAIVGADVCHLLAPPAAAGAPLLATLRHQRAAVLFARGKVRASAAELGELLAADADADTLGGARAPAAAFLHGLCLARDGRHIEAVERLNDAVSARPDVPAFRHERAKALQLACEHAAAVHDFTAVLAAQPYNAAARFRRGFSHKALGEYAAAADDFEAAAILQPEGARLALPYARIHAIDAIELCAPGCEPDTPPLIF